MATSKTLNPTNVTISIPEMTDSPNASVFSNCVDKEADAINEIAANIGGIKYLYSASATNHVINVPSGSQHLVIIGCNNVECFYIGYIAVSSTGGISKKDVITGSNTTIDISENNKLKVSIGSTARRLNVYCLPLYGSAMSV